MARYAVAVVVLGLYIAGSAWIVGREGAAYREALRLRERSQATDPAPAPDPASVVPKATPPEPPSPQPEIVAPKEHVKPAPQPAAKPPAMPKAEPAPPPAAPKPPDPKPEPKAEDVKPGGFWDTPERRKSWDVDHLALDEEMILGKQLHDLILTYYPEDRDDAPYQERIRKAAAPIEEAVGRKGLNYTYTILDDDEANAFSHLGGYIYLTRGMFTSILGEDPDDDGALQFLLAHEIAHVDQQHMIQCLQQTKELKMGTLFEACTIVIPFGYKPEQELAADKWAYEQMRKLDRSRFDRMKFIRAYVEYARKMKFLDRRDLPPKDNPLRHHIIAPVKPLDRLKALEALDSPPPTKPAR